MIILRLSDLFDFLENEYEIPFTQKKFAEFAKLSPDRLSRIKLKPKKLHIEKKAIKNSLTRKRNKRRDGEKAVLENVTTDFLNQILEGAWTLILHSKKRVKEVDEKDLNKEDLFRKLVRIFIDYIPDCNSPVYEKTLKSKDAASNFIDGYREVAKRPAPYRSDVEYRSALRARLLSLYNQKTSPK